MKKGIRFLMVLAFAICMMLSMVGCGEVENNISDPDDVVVEATLVGIEVSTLPTTTNYVSGEEFNKEGMVVVGIYDDNTVKGLTDWTVDKTILMYGDTVVTVTYETFTAKVNVTVSKAIVVGVEITTEPTKTEYESGDSFDTTGMVVKATYSDNTTEEVTDYTVSPSILTKGIEVVTISYGGFSDTVAVTVEDAIDYGDPVAFRMEGENAEFTLTNDDYYYDYRHLGYSEYYSGGLATRNAGYVGDKTTFNFTSDRAETITMKVMIGGHPDNGLDQETDYDLDETTKITANGVAVDLEGIDLEPDTMTVKSVDSTFMIFKEIELVTTLVAGDNTIELEMLIANCGGSNIDYIDLMTTCTITDWDDTYYADSVNSTWAIDTKPTESATGKIKVTSGSDTSKYTLPKLAADSIYDIVTVDDTTTYSFELKGETFSFDVVDPNWVDPSAPVTVTSISAAIGTHTYNEGDTFYAADLTDLVVTATSSDSSTAILTAGDYTLSIADGTELSTSDSTITVTYTDNTSIITTFGITIIPTIPVNTYRLEGENAEIELVGGDTYADATKIAFGTDFSGGLSTSGCNSVVDGEGDTTTFNFTSSVADTVDMDVLISANNGNALAEIMSITVNESVVDTTGMEFSDVQEYGGNQYWNYELMTVEIELVEGSNSIVFEQVTDNVGGNIDFIEFDTTGTISDWDDAHYEDTNAVWTIDAVPTESATGSITTTTGASSRTFTLPMLSTANGYSEDAGIYSLEVKGTTYTFTADGTQNASTVTLSGGATFEGGDTSYTGYVGDSLPTISAPAGETRTIGGVYATSDVYTTYGVSEYEMMYGETELGVYYANEDLIYAPWDIGGTGDAWGTTDKKQTCDSVSCLTQTSGNPGTAGTVQYDPNAVVGDELGSVFSYTGQTDEFFRYMSNAPCTNGVSYTYTHTLKNMGSSAISFTFGQAHTGSTIDADTLSDTITLEAGETQTITYDYTETADNTNSIFVVTMKADASSALLGVSSSYVEL